MHNEIIVGIGLGDINFGISREELILKINEPDEIEELIYEHTNKKAELYHYDALGMSLEFSEEDDWKLTSMSVTSEDYMLNGYHILGKSKEDVFDILKKIHIGRIEREEFLDEEDDEDFNAELYVVKTKRLNFWFEDNTLIEVFWEPLLKNNKVIWP